jgi:hypothetical protein
MEDRKQRNRKSPDTRYKERHFPNGLLPPGRPDLLKFSPPPKITPPHELQGAISYSNHYITTLETNI